MSSSWYTVEMKSTREEINPLLPFITGIIENEEEVSFSEIKRQIETEFERKVSETEIMYALENGIRLGIFNMEREFKVCREFTTKELKKLEKPKTQWCGTLRGASQKTLLDKNVIDYVKKERQKRKWKQCNKRRKTSGSFSKQRNDKLYQYLCRRCKNSIERELERSRVSFVPGRKWRRGSRGSKSSWGTSSSNDSCKADVKLGERAADKPLEKSRLLVEKNPMETELPYYDILA